MSAPRRASRSFGARAVMTAVSSRPIAGSTTGQARSCSCSGLATATPPGWFRRQCAAVQRPTPRGTRGTASHVKRHRLGPVEIDDGRPRPQVQTVVDAGAYRLADLDRRPRVADQQLGLRFAEGCYEPQAGVFVLGSRRGRVGVRLGGRDGGRFDRPAGRSGSRTGWAIWHPSATATSTPHRDLTHQATVHSR